jgi:hypothetical protein
MSEKEKVNVPPAPHEGIWGNGSVVPLILNLCTRLHNIFSQNLSKDSEIIRNRLFMFLDKLALKMKNTVCQK